MRVAVVGTGLGGAFTADSLATLANLANLTASITVFEMADRCGGRALDTKDDETMPAEVGAAVVITKNAYFTEAAEQLGLHLVMPPKPAGTTAILGPNGFVFEESQSSHFAAPLTAYRMQRAFGLRHLTKLRAVGLEFIKNFSRICAPPQIDTHLAQHIV